MDSCKDDTRQWNRIHLEAAGKIPSPSILALTPPSNEQYSTRDVNAKGPGMGAYNTHVHRQRILVAMLFVLKISPDLLTM